MAARSAWAQAGLPHGAGGHASAPGRARPDRLGDACPPQGRPDRLPLADPALRRPDAVFLFVPPSEVAGVAERFDGDAVRHRGRGRVLEPSRRDFAPSTPWSRSSVLRRSPPARLATIVRGADTARLDLAPEAPGLLAASLGLSRMYADDLAQLEAGMALYDAFYRWCRDATEETHNWPARSRGA